MINYIKADLYRYFRRIPRWIILAFILFIVYLTVSPNADAPKTGAENVRLFEDVMCYIPVGIGICEMLYVFTDDFKGKTAQIAIGVGIRRRHVILAKWIEFIILAVFDTFLCAVVAMITTSLTASSFPPELYGELVISCVMCVISVISYIALVFPLLFISQGTTIALALYVFLSAGWIHKLINAIGSIDELAFLHLSNYTLTNCLNVFRSRWILGSFHVTSVIGIILYTAAFLGLTVALYHKKELDF